VQQRRVDLGIEGGGLDGGMAEESPNGGEGDSLTEQGRGGRMPKDMESREMPGLMPLL